MYHDQVLAPFKTLYEFDAINITLGLKYLRGDINQELEKIYSYFNRLKDISKKQAGFTSGGDQQMIASINILSTNTAIHPTMLVPLGIMTAAFALFSLLIFLMYFSIFYII